MPAPLGKQGAAAGWRRRSPKKRRGGSCAAIMSLPLGILCEVYSAVSHFIAHFGLPERCTTWTARMLFVSRQVSNPTAPLGPYVKE